MSKTAAVGGRTLAHGSGALRTHTRRADVANPVVRNPACLAVFSSVPCLNSISCRVQHSPVSRLYSLPRLRHSSFMGAPPDCVQSCTPVHFVFQKKTHSRSYANAGHKRSAKLPIRAGQSAGTAGQFSDSPQYLQLAQTAVKKLGVALVVAAVIAGASLFSLPWVLSTPAGLKTATALYSATISGTISVDAAKLGWQKPVSISGVKVSDAQGAEVLTVQQIESEASLWGIVSGKHGLGNTTVQGFRVDLGREATGGEPRALAALAKPQKQAGLQRGPLRTPTEAPLPKTGDEVPLSVEINVEMPGGSLKFPHSVFTVPWDTAALTGDTVQIDIAAGDFAARRDAEAAALAAGGAGPGPKEGAGVPVVVAARSEKFRGAAAGAVDVLGGKVYLARPLEADIEINRTTGQLFLARLNPLLAGVVGTQNSGQLVRVFASPQDMVLPTEQYSLKVDPMTLVLGRGELVGNALEFLGQKGPGRTLTMRTSAIRATWHAAGRVEAARTDLKIGDKVHLITWGTMDWGQGNLDMVLAIPADTLKVALRVPTVASGYNLQFPLTGSVERPTLDWKAAGKQFTKLVVRHRAPNGWTGVLLNDRNDRRPLPEPLDPLPWAQS